MSGQWADIAPIYDCGSCLYPQLDEVQMKKVLSDEQEINQRVYLFPTSAILDYSMELLLKQGLS